MDQQVLDYLDSIDLDFTIKDDIGNVYDGTNFGGRGFPNDISTGKTLEKIDERAKTLTIVPHVRLTKSSEMMVNKPKKRMHSVNQLLAMGQQK
ncbi:MULTISPECIES: hypothetical protein [unclassified Lysinibacillus]|uniref:hypothetical protein n=1 Tax=unclassified Lysinibacillus TaxID=2636778 RepID=UPI0037FC3481